MTLPYSLRRALWIAAVTAVPAMAVAAPADDAGLVVVSDATSPKVAYNVGREANVLVLTVNIGSFTPDGSGTSLSVGLAADKSLTLTDKDAKISRAAGQATYVFRIPAASLATNDAGWAKLRLGMTVAWAGGPAGVPRQIGSYMQDAVRAPHGTLAANPASWQHVDLGEFERLQRDRKQRITIAYTQPLDGKATVVIEDANGKRVRNLISGVTMEKGPQTLVWDGCDDSGSVVGPGTYRWRSIAHPGLKPRYQMSYADAPGSNHSTFRAATTNGTHLFFGAPVTEGGYELVQLAQDGTFVRGFNAPHGHGLGQVAIAADEKYLYAAYDGTSWGEAVNRDKADWKADNEIGLARFDLATGNTADFSKTARLASIKKYTVGPGSPDKAPDKLILAGMALFSGKLYVGDSGTGSILEVDPVTGAVGRSIPAPGIIALTGGSGLYGLAGNKLVQIDPASGQIKPIATLSGKPASLTAGAAGEFFVSDAEAQLVRIVRSGKEAAAVGKPGGVEPGPYDPMKFHNPRGVVLSPSGQLWVTEQDRWEPKRLAAFDPKSNTLWREYFGPTAYGAPGAGFDPLDSTHWIGQNTLFSLDMKAKTTKPISMLGGETGFHVKFWRQDGRTFIISYGKVTYIQEVTAKGTLKPLAFLSSAHQFSYSNNWKPPQVFVEAFNKAYPAQKYEGTGTGRPGHGFGMIWVDKNGDGQMQVEEFEFATGADNFAGSGWGQDLYNLTMRAPATVGGKKVLVKLEPQGWYPGGAPKYPSLDEAIKQGVPIDLASNSSVEGTVDKFGTLILNSDPVMKAFSPDGKTLWSYPNKWTNVHGSHAAPLPSVGELQGVIFFTGVAPLDDKGDVMAMNGNHGRLFLMTTDGLYIDEMFPDVRMMSNPQAGGEGILGGECFGGTFGRSEKDGTYYFQGGGIEYRIYKIEGLDKTVRSGGTLTVSADQAASAERSRGRLLAEATDLKTAVIPRPAKAPVIDGKPEDWKGDPTVQWNKSNMFPIQVRAAQDSTNLYLQYTVRADSSPWVNNGKDWQALFKTGDSVDLQLGTNPDANPKRTSPVPGDIRLLVAPFQGNNIAVLYRHRQPGATDGVVFQSPWRSEKVDSVKKLDNAKIAVTKGADWYNVEISIPLADLGLQNAAGKKLRGDFGVIYGDADGTVNTFRNYWANQATGLVNDVPGEIMLSPNLWGDLTWEAGQ